MQIVTYICVMFDVSDVDVIIFLVNAMVGLFDKHVHMHSLEIGGECHVDTIIEEAFAWWRVCSV